MAAAGKRPFLDRLANFDRRWIFLAMGLAIVIPLLMPLELPFRASPMVTALYRTIDELQEGDVVYVSVDLDPASTPELEPFFRALMIHLKRKKVKIAFGSTWYAAPPLVERWLRQYVEPDDLPAGYHGDPITTYKKNVDYAWLGFREGRTAVIQKLGSDLWGNYDGRDADRTPLAKIPLMEGKKRIGDFKLVILVSAGSPGAKEFVQQIQSPYNLRIVASVTSVMTTDMTPYYQTNQLLGLAGGMLASAEYEQMVGFVAIGSKGADVLNVGHLVVILAIVLGNIVYFAGRRRRMAG